jgi:hypothetical protein
VTPDLALAYLNGAYTALVTTPPGIAVIAATLALVALAEAVTP